MLVLGFVFLILGLSPAAPRIGYVTTGILFVWMGAVLLVGAFLGILFTKCPHCYRTTWVICLHEKDVVHDFHYDQFYRELSPGTEEE